MTETELIVLQNAEFKHWVQAAKASNTTIKGAMQQLADVSVKIKMVVDVAEKTIPEFDMAFRKYSECDKYQRETGKNRAEAELALKNAKDEKTKGEAKKKAELAKAADLKAKEAKKVAREKLDKIETKSSALQPLSAELSKVAALVAKLAKDFNV